MIDPSGRMTQWTFDARDRQEETRDHFGVVLARNVYNDRSLRTEVQVQHPDGTGLFTAGTWAYNGKGEVETYADALDEVTSYVHDQVGNLVSVTAPGNVTTVWEHDVLNRVRFQRQAFGTAGRVDTEFDYDANSNRTLVRAYNASAGAYTAVHRFHYDLANRLEEIESSGGQSESWRYDEHGDRVGHFDSNGKETQFEHDVLGRMRAEVHLGVFSRRIEREYDGAGNVVAVVQRAGTGAESAETFRSDMQYDFLSRVTGVTWTVGGAPFRSVSYGYDDSSCPSGKPA